MAFLITAKSLSVEELLAQASDNGDCSPPLELSGPISSRSLAIVAGKIPAHRTHDHRVGSALSISPSGRSRALPKRRIRRPFAKVRARSRRARASTSTRAQRRVTGLRDCPDEAGTNNERRGVYACITFAGMFAGTSTVIGV
jgi:hypothetical protein